MKLEQILFIILFCVIGIAIFVCLIIIAGGILFNKFAVGKVNPFSKRANNSRLKFEENKIKSQSFEAKESYLQAKAYFYEMCGNDEKLKKVGKRVSIKGYKDLNLSGQILYQSEFISSKNIVTILKNQNEENVRKIKNIAEEKKFDKWIIAVHGYKSSGDLILCDVFPFLQRGYNVLLPDLRGHGLSDGKYVGMGYHDHFDLLKWIDYLVSIHPDCKIALFGLSMGASTVMTVSGEKLPKNVKAIIEDCGFTSYENQMKHLFSLRGKKYKKWLMKIYSKINKIMWGYDYKQPDAIKYLKNNTTIPMLFLHGEKDDFVPVKFAKDAYNAVSVKEKELLIIPNAGHTYSMHKDYLSYFNIVDKFLDRHVGK